MNAENVFISAQVDVDICDIYVGDVEEIKIVENQINYNSSNQIICATSAYG